MDLYLKKPKSSDSWIIRSEKEKMDKLYEEAKEFSSEISCFNDFEEKRAAAAEILPQLYDKSRKGGTVKKFFLLLAELLISGGIIAFFLSVKFYVTAVLCGIAALLFIIRFFVDKKVLVSIAVAVLGVALFVPAFLFGKDILGIFGGILFASLDAALFIGLLPRINSNGFYDVADFIGFLLFPLNNDDSVFFSLVFHVCTFTAVISAVLGFIFGWK